MFVLLIIVVALGLWSRKRVFVAPCNVSLIYADGRPAKDMRVSESWDAYAYDLSGGADIQTNGTGQAFFPEQSATHSLLFWSLKPLLTRLNYGVHASSGITALISVSEPGRKRLSGDTDAFSCSDRDCVNHPIILHFQLAIH